MNKGIFAFGLERLGRVSIFAPRISLAVLLALTAVCLIGLTTIKFDDELRRLFRSDHAVHKTYERMNRLFPIAEHRLVLLVESKRKFDTGQLEAIRNLHLDLQFINGVTGVVSMFSARFPPDSDGVARPLFPADLPGGIELDRLFERAHRHPLISDRLLSKQWNAALLVVSLKSGARSFKGVSTLLRDTGRLTGQVAKQAGLTITPTGAPSFRFEILSAIRTDLQVLNAMGALIAILVCFAFFRTPALVFMASLPPLVAVVWTVGGFGLLGLPITALNNVLPTLVLVIAFSDSLHMVQAIRRRLARGEDVRAAAHRAVDQVGPACAMTTLTTMIACLSLTFSQSEAVREFGLAAAVAIFFAYVAVICIIPALALVLLKPATGPAKTGSRWSFEHLADVFSGWLWTLVSRKAHLLAGLSLPLLAVTGTLYFLIGTSYDYREYLAPESPANKAIDRINAKLGGGDSIFVLIEQLPGQKAKRHNADQVIRAVHDILSVQPKVHNVMSTAGIGDWLKREANVRPDAQRRFIRKLPPHMAGRLTSPSGTAWLVSANIPATPAPKTRRLLTQLDTALQRARDRFGGYTITPTGIVAVGAFASEHLINSLKESLLAAVLITIVVIAITAGAVVPALLSAIPNLLSLTIVAAALYALGLGFQITSVLALTIAFGIAVDNTIHVLNRLRLERRTLDTSRALQATLAKVGPVLIAATAVLSLGLAVTQFSGLPMFQLFGKLCIVVLATALLAALIVLPALILVTTEKTDNS